MPTDSKRAAAKWEEMFDEAVALASARQLAATLSKIKRIRSWQRQTDHGAANNSWHDAELLYLEALALDRARQTQKAQPVWTKLTKLYLKEKRQRGDDWFLPFCKRCASRTLGFAPSWYVIACEVRSERNVSRPRAPRT